jgi:hypothetical protein
MKPRKDLSNMFSTGGRYIHIYIYYTYTYTYTYAYTYLKFMLDDWVYHMDLPGFCRVLKPTVDKNGGILDSQLCNCRC